MKKQLYILILLMLPVLGWGQQQSFTIQDNLNSVTILPYSIETRREGAGFDTSKHNLVLGKGNLLNPNTGTNNIAIGINTLTNNGLAANNIALGNNALYANKEGSVNVAIGNNSLKSSDNTYNNVGVGYGALMKQTIGNENTAIGSQTLGYGSATSASLSRNTAAGFQSMYGSNSGIENTAIGFKALYASTSGSYNVAIGAYTMEGNNPYLNSGSNNVCVGYKSLFWNRVGNNNVAIGFESGLNEVGSNKLYIENSNSSTPLIGGDFANDIVGVNMPITSLSANPTWKLQVGGDINASGSVRAAGVVLTSDVRFKKDIEQLTNALGQIIQLRGVSYYWNQSKFPSKNFTDSNQMGFIAQEIEKIFPEIVETDAEGYKSVNYVQLTPLMVEAIKELNSKIENLEKQNLELKASISGIYEILNKQVVNSSQTETSK